jgi:hypothetical protein
MAAGGSVELNLRRRFLGILCNSSKYIHLGDQHGFGTKVKRTCFLLSFH